MEKEEAWDIIIEPKNNLLKLNLKEVRRYKDLLLLFVRRDFVAEYKQTILGPIWYLIQPVFTAITYFFILNKMGGIPTDELPPMLFYMSGLTLWNYFSSSLTKTSETFLANAPIFGKVYFPRLIVPLAVITSNLIKLALQFGLLIFFIAYFHFQNNNFSFTWHWQLMFLPIPIVLMAGLSLSLGLIVSALTTKYRDLKFALTFGVQLLMYGSAVIISLNNTPEKFKSILQWNPIANVIEMFRAVLLGNRPIEWMGVIYSTVLLIIILLIGIVIFNRTEKTFMDTV
ncbi:MAG: lipopolysaccharide transport system permease protein [Vicingaceae bacterium]|jgi:lipopolysaccharide transport system permease protein